MSVHSTADSSLKNQSLWFASLLCIHQLWISANRLAPVVGQITPPKDVHDLTPGTLDFYLEGQKGIGRGDYIRILRWGDDTDDLGVPSVITGTLCEGEA